MNRRPLRREKLPRPRLDEDALRSFLEQNFSAWDLEVGAGVGWHALQRAEAFPDRGLLSIERTLEKFRSFENRLRHHPELPNLKALHADAIGVAAHFLKPDFFDKIFFLYPNPEPKNPSQRWIRAPHFELFLEILKSGGEIVFATNEEFYKDEILEHVSNWDLHLSKLQSWTENEAPPPRSHFEKKYLERGQTVWNICLQKGAK